MKVRTIKQADGSVWAVPVDVIARSRATFYADEFGGDVEKSLAEDTLPLFEESPYQIHEWASGDMNWSEVKQAAWKLRDATLEQNDFQEAWVNGEHGIEDVDASTQPGAMAP